MSERESNKKYVLDEAFHWIFDRKSGLLYTIYFTSFILFNWKFFYVLLVSSDLTGGARIDAALAQFLNRSFLGLSYGNYTPVQFIVPAVITFGVVLLLPKLNNFAYRKSLYYKKERDLEQLRTEVEVEEEKAKLLKSKVSSISDQVVSYGELEKKVTDLLEQVASLENQLGKSSSISFDSEDIYFQLNEISVRDNNQVLKLSVGKDYDLKFRIINRSKLMAKKVEAGLSLETEIIKFQSDSGYSVYEEGKESVVRYSAEFIHANTNQKKSNLRITALKTGEFTIETFVKGENFASVYRTLKLEIIE